MRSNSNSASFGLPICLLAVGLATVEPTLALKLATRSASSQGGAGASEALHSQLLDKCCRLGGERAFDSRRSSCKMEPREASASGQSSNALTAAEALLLAREPEIGEQCELVLESCCLAEHRKRNCDSGKQFAKLGSSCMDVELSKEASLATESFNDCCMSCSLGILAAKTSRQSSDANGTSSLLIERCKLMNPLASSLSGQMYEHTYIECCQENLPRQSNALTEPGQPIDCGRSNPCSQRCVRGSHADRCDCFVGWKLAPDGLNCVDVDECQLNQHSCNRKSEICDNIAGGFRCLARNQHASSHHGRSSLSLQLNGHNEQDEPSEVTRWGALGPDEGGLMRAAHQFSSLRLCPLNSRWNEQEKRCVESPHGISSSSSSSSSSRQHHSRVISSFTRRA